MWQPTAPRRPSAHGPETAIRTPSRRSRRAMAPSRGRRTCPRRQPRPPRTPPEPAGTARDLRQASALLADSTMPKMKTHSGAKKRFRLTATGKVRGRRAFSTHILEKKSPKRKRFLGHDVILSDHDAPRVKKLLKPGK